jgi:hypothetical protein
MIVTKGGVAFPISRNVVFAIVLISVILVASTAAVTYAVLSASGKIGSSGRIIAIGVKVTAVGSNQDLTSIDWGDLIAGSTATRQISVINNGTVPTTTQTNRKENRQPTNTKNPFPHAKTLRCSTIKQKTYST